MNDNMSVAGPYDSFPDLDDDCRKMCDDMCKGCTSSEISNMGDYLISKASKMRETMANTVKLEDFEKMRELLKL